MLGDDHAAGAQQIGGSQDRAEVARILDPVERVEQRGRFHGYQIFELGIAERAEPRDDTLVARALACRAIERSAIAILDADPRGARCGHDLRDRIAGALVGAARIDPDRAHVGRSAREHLAHRTGAIDAAVVAHVSSATIARAAAAGSGASRNGRPTTTRSAPAARASRGVITRF